MAGSNEYDVIVIGGGPAGATTATLVAQTGRKVLLIERQEQPGFKVGESLMPATYWTFKRLGVLERLRDSAFIVKSSVQFYSKTGKASRPFYFFENDDHESSKTWQVVRSDFDGLLLENAQKHGVELLTGARVLDIINIGKKIEGILVKQDDGPNKTLTAKVIVDASGQSALISRKLGIRKNIEDLKNASIYTHFKGAHRDQGIDEGATIILQTKEANSWFWYIPLPDDVVSVGVVGDIGYLLQNRNGTGYEDIFAEELELCPALQPKLENAQQLFPVRTIKDFSYRATQMAGDGWILVGDAYGFLDPIYSSGVFLALKSGELAADAITDAFERNDFTEKQLGKFEPKLLEGMTSIRNLIYAFYARDFSFGKFLQEHKDCTQDVVNILIGNVFDRDMSGLFSSLRKNNVIPAN